MKKPGSVNAGRVLHALGRIGYHPVSAILDIVDNSVSAQATQIRIDLEIKMEERTGAGRRRAYIESISILDNGSGLDEKGLDNALTLGAAEKSYSQGTLSKFGMGLKSAASSLGRKLEIISRVGMTEALRAAVDQDELGDEYCYDLEPASQQQLDDLDAFTGGKAGTIIRITKVNSETMPSVAEIIELLRIRAGVSYFYYIRGEVPNAQGPVSIWINDEQIRAIDPLFSNEIEDGVSGNLDEVTWDGLKPKWISKRQAIQLDALKPIHGYVEVTQLPHPPSIEKVGGSRPEVRDKYMIDLQNYGFYIYRNYRLISWADHLEGKQQKLVPFDKALYGFRGRLLIGSSADDILNLDVTKSRITLSELATDQVLPIIRESVRKSRGAWRQRTDALRSLNDQDPHNKANQVLDQFAKLEEKDDEIDEEAVPSKERKRLQGRRARAQNRKPATPEDQERLQRHGERVQYVSALDNNQLWERAHDPDHGLTVRVNSAHRFISELVQGGTDSNPQLLITLDYLFYSLARAEYSLVYKSDIDDDLVEKVMQEFRERVGEELSSLLRRSNVKGLLNSGEE